MRKHILVFNSMENYKEDVEYLNEKGYQCTFCQDEEVLYDTVKSDKTICAVVVFNLVPEQQSKYLKVIKRLKTFERMSVRAIVSVVGENSEVDINEIRYFDELVLETAKDFFYKYRIDKMYKSVKMREEHLAEIDELLLMYESMTNLVTATFYKTVKRAEQHSVRVQKIANCVSKIYSRKYPDRIDDRDLSIIDNLVLLHDIGLTYVNQDVVFQSRTLSREEELEFRKHTLIGGRVFREVKENLIEKYGKSPKFLERAIEFTEYHHEKGDGSGYPFGLFLEQIPLYARIVSVSEYIEEELTSLDDALEFIMNMLSRNANPKFDQEIVAAIIENYDELIEVIEKNGILDRDGVWSN